MLHEEASIQAMAIVSLASAAIELDNISTLSSSTPFPDDHRAFSNIFHAHAGHEQQQLRMQPPALSGAASLAYQFPCNFLKCTTAGEPVTVATNAALPLLKNACRHVMKNPAGLLCPAMICYERKSKVVSVSRLYIKCLPYLPRVSAVCFRSCIGEASVLSCSHVCHVGLV